MTLLNVLKIFLWVDGDKIVYYVYFFNSLNIPECVYIYTYMQSNYLCLLRFFYVIINKYYEKEWKVNIYNNHTQYK